ncbi:UvrD-helicase domain-containing protein [Rhizobium ruizarguesonis]|uniref:UvrD-helicase domain-containing protein n=1 Tax=Rhizobium ruizarguesonis TaxID=2081791 RepID=UPI0014467DC2|nr:UvrD-helicase domain-containing protein [Rhizobium ruizarguesonis]NKQ83460.1 ATP-dependent helicase [Rhizobium ruizarguesonis]
MSTVRVAVRQAGQIVDTIDRPLRETAGVPAVVYRRKLWRLIDGHIDLDEPSLDRSGAEAPILTAGAGAASRMLLIEQPDDTDARQEIINAPAAARMIVEAGPGMGKTELAARRLASLIRNELSPAQILVLSFSRSAVRTLTSRLGRIGETDPRVLEELRHLSVRTFDSWAFRMLRLLGEAPRILLTRSHDSNIAALTKLAAGPRRDDIRRFMGDRRHLIVDEFQDLPGVRGDLVLTLLSLLAPRDHKGCGFTILGDPAQAIFGFARGVREDGAPFPSPQEYWQQVSVTYGGQLVEKRLARNFRADPPLAHMSAELRGVLVSSLSEKEKLRHMLAAVAALPEPSRPLGRDLLGAATGGSRAILTQTNGEALRVLRALYGEDPKPSAISVRLHAGSHATLPPAWIGGLLRKLRSTSLPRTQFARIHALLTKLWGEEACLRLGLPDEEVAWGRLAQASGAAKDATAIDVGQLRERVAWPDAFPDDQPLAEDAVIVTTVHQSKGMEFDVVTLLEPSDVGDEEGDEAADNASDETQGERASVAYVAVTRAAKSLDRASADQILQAPVHWEFAGGRRRLCSRQKNWINMEMGLRGDVDPIGFADPALLGGPAGVEDLQAFLLSNAGALAGQKVMLCKQHADGKAVWHICIQEGTKPGRLIGRTANQLSLDLLSVLHKRGFQLPRIIMNLRISSVGTVTSDGAVSLGEPEKTSGLWLGVGLFGTGDFQTWKDKK